MKYKTKQSKALWFISLLPDIFTKLKTGPFTATLFRVPLKDQCHSCPYSFLYLQTVIFLLKIMQTIIHC